MIAISPEQMHAILTGLVCPYCMVETRLVDSVVIYGPGRNFGWIRACPNCGAYVGCHKGTTEAKGRVANKELRFWKAKAHEEFDQLWKRKMKQGFSQQWARDLAYAWLSKMIGTKPEYTHIGMFNIEQCKKVVDLCLPYTKPDLYRNVGGQTKIR